MSGVSIKLKIKTFRRADHLMHVDASSCQCILCKKHARDIRVRHFVPTVTAATSRPTAATEMGPNAGRARRSVMTPTSTLSRPHHLTYSPSHTHPRHRYGPARLNKCVGRELGRTLSVAQCDRIHLRSLGWKQRRVNIVEHGSRPPRTPRLRRPRPRPPCSK